MLDRRAVIGGHYENRIRDVLFVSLCLDENHVIFLRAVRPLKCPVWRFFLTRTMPQPSRGRGSPFRGLADTGKPWRYWKGQGMLRLEGQHEEDLVSWDPVREVYRERSC